MVGSGLTWDPCSSLLFDERMANDGLVWHGVLGTGKGLLVADYAGGSNRLYGEVGCSRWRDTKSLCFYHE